MYLLDKGKLNKFWHILSCMDRHCSKIYVRGNVVFSSTGEPSMKCQKEVFVERVNRVLKNRSVQLQVFENGSYYTQYLTILSISYPLAYSDKITVRFIDLSRPLKIQHQDMEFNELSSLEGVFGIPDKTVNSLMRLFASEPPMQTFTFVAYDKNKFGSRKNKFGQTTWKTQARGFAEAYRNKKNYDGHLIISDLI